MKELLTGKKKEKSLCGKMTLKQRLTGFLICCICGWCLAIISFLLLIVGKKDLVKFAVIYSLGNLINILATSFLYGFSAQFKKMFKKTRVITSVIFLLSMAATLVLAFVLTDGPVKRLSILAAMTVQFCSYFWYSLSFIPFGRTIAKKCCKKCIKQMDEG